MGWKERVDDWEIEGDEVIFYDENGEEIDRASIYDLVEFYLEYGG